MPPVPCLTRRQTLSGAAALVGGSVLGLSPAAAAPSSNPMPTELRKALERDPQAPVLGNPRGDVTLTEFFDYNCPHCRPMSAEVEALIGEDPNLRVVFRELPVFGVGSVFAAKASLASLEQGKYWPFHRSLMSIRGRAEEASVIATARKIGLDETRLRTDMNAQWVKDHLTTSLDLADHMGLIGTPTFIAGDEALFGRQTRAELWRLIATARKTLGER
ncbi:DsbA family protein [uncultured Paracoccus sp.]|uniref:DsbA family protein n=1 Tax=uncultured Paracoccus sp. TaxID=189685 RepID=UPI002637418E|nr:DsbA family protein [uncultured Paracoccus sp.]